MIWSRKKEQSLIWRIKMPKQSCMVRPIVLCLVFLCFLNLSFSDKTKEKDPVEILKGKWSAFDFEYTDDWEVEIFGFFVLRTPQFMEEYYALLKERQDISDEDIAQDMALVEEFLIVEASMEALKKEKLIVDNWKFELKDKNKNKFKPIKVESSPITRGDEYIASYRAFTPFTVEKRKAGKTVEKTTPVFFVPEKASDWTCTFLLYFPITNPETEELIFHKRSKELELVAKTRGTTLKGKWKVEKLLEQE
jgi:hypothetical protein